MIVIGLSGKARHGKGSVVQLAQILMQSGDNEREVRQVSFATALKETARYIVERTHMDKPMTDSLLGLPNSVAQEVCAMAAPLTLDDLVQKTPPGRKFLQFIGTEAFRKNVDDLYWVKRARDAISALPPETKIVFVPDVRFTNEADFVVKEMRGQIWRINRFNPDIDRTPFDNGLTPEQKAHPSETQLDDYKFDVVVNSTNMADLFDAVKAQLKRLGFG